MTSVAYKLGMALSGAVLLLFVCAHLAGNLLVYFGAEALKSYARTLHDNPFLLWPVRVILAGCVLNHIFVGLWLFFKNRAGDSYVRKRYLTATFSSRSMAPTGIVILFFILYHLAHLTLKITDSRFASLESHDVYGMLMLSFSDPAVTSFYIISMIFLGLHLNHGIASMMQTFGIKSGKDDISATSTGLTWLVTSPNLITSALFMIAVASKGLAWLIMLGNISIPLSIYLGILQ